MSKVFSVAAMALLVFVALRPAEWQPRSGIGFEIDHFVGYFVFTLMFCFAWPRPLAGRGSLHGLRGGVGKLAIFFTGSLVLFCGGVVQRSWGVGRGSAC